ncbi:autotransporter assembly complex protein TamA [Legionella spiritensis]|uniref:autotransporter assembly complex protein TamA n=1 Tax=Legionella spiritensis TaxID=452 RepID=UPI000F6EDC9A|nr:BamA/TamA family outer membrane protein [Legionella spiritensis]VEG90595.1 outer membrane protein [Legionella spiritensis]
MRKRLCVLILVCCIPLLMAADSAGHVDIKGVDGDLLTNIQLRLKEFSPDKPLAGIPDKILITQVANAISPYGYFKPRIRLQRSGDGRQIQIIVNPGPQLRINRLSVQLTGDGAANMVIKNVLNDLPVRQGGPLNSVNYKEAKDKLIDAAESQGYLRASFDKAEILIDKARYTSAITLIFNTGPQFYFGQVIFNPTYISPDLLRRYLPFQYGQPYSTDKLLMFNNNLSSSGYFSTVLVKPEINGHRTIPINVHLQAVARINYSLGIGYGTDTGPRGRAGLHIVPVNRAGHKFNAIAVGSFNQNSLQAQYVIPGKNPVTDEFYIAGNLANLDYNSGYSNALLMSLGQRHQGNKFQRILSLNGLYERFNYDNAPKENKLTLYPKATLTWTNTANRVFSPTGYNVTVNGLIANKKILSALSFAQASVDAKAAITLPQIRTRFYFHTIQGVTQINDINQLPLSLALLLGGADNLKAYSFNSIGPGKILSFAGVEIQKETVDNWYLIGFFDSGDVYMPSLKALKNDVGIGLMWVSPVGPIKIGIAQAVDTGFNRIRDKKPKLVVNIGPDL